MLSRQRPIGHRVQRRKSIKTIAIRDRLDKWNCGISSTSSRWPPTGTSPAQVQRIHVVQSALSAAVAKLEKELGVALFDRSKRQIELTAAGQAFLQHAREVLHAAHRAQSSVDDYPDQLTGTVTLGTLMSWGTLNLPAALEAFR